MIILPFFSIILLVMYMEIEKIQLEYVFKSGFTSSLLDKQCDIKVLPYLSVAQAVEGSYAIRLSGGETHHTGAKGFFIAPSDIQQTITHQADEHSGIIVCRWIFLKVKINGIYDWDSYYDFPVIIPESVKEEMNLLFNRLFAADNIFDEYVCYYEIVRLLSCLATRRERHVSQHLNNSLTYIKEHYREKLTVQSIARAVNLSSSHLFAIFKKETHISPIAYLNNYRLSVAADLLLRTDKTITEIADLVGVGDSIYFNKMFRKYYYLPPSKYREIHKT